jgi:hypothetical protein
MFSLEFTPENVVKKIVTFSPHFSVKNGQLKIVENV